MHQGLGSRRRRGFLSNEQLSITAQKIFVWLFFLDVFGVLPRKVREQSTVDHERIGPRDSLLRHASFLENGFERGHGVDRLVVSRKREIQEELAESEQRNPASLELMVAMAKKFLSKPEYRIQLDDLLTAEHRRHMEMLAPIIADQTMRGPDTAKWRETYEHAAAPLAHLGAVIGKWGDDGHHSLLISIIKEMVAEAAKNPSGLHMVFWKNFKFYPAFLLFTDRRIKAMVTQVPATDLYRQIAFEAPPAQRQLLHTAIANERLAHFRGEAPATMKLADQADKPSVFGVESLAWSQHNEAQHPTFHNAVTISSLEHALETAPGDYIESVSPTPLLLIMAEPDKTVLTQFTKDAFARAGEPKKLITFEGLHYDAYDRPEILKTVSEAAREWFVTHLKP